jgi:hypothetical protein
MPYIHCPDCNAVRETDTAACPECGRCANCGEKLAESVYNCPCGFPADEKLAGRIIKRYGIPDDAVELEKAKWERRKKLEPVKIAARILLLGVCIFLGLMTAWPPLSETTEQNKIVLGLPVICMLVLLYWVFFQGIGRIILWIARKIGIMGQR